MYSLPLLRIYYGPLNILVPDKFTIRFLSLKYAPFLLVTLMNVNISVDAEALCGYIALGRRFPMTKPHILIVDDDVFIIETLRSYLEILGYRVTSAYGCQTALGHLKTS